MARVILTAVVIVLINILVGCYSPDSGQSQLIPTRMKDFNIVESTETDIVEQMATQRLGYRRYLESLIAYYEKTGNNMKLVWAKDEMQKLNTIPQYRYIVDAGIPGPDLKARQSIAEAELMYRKAYKLEQQARGLLVVVDEKKLRNALDQYNKLITKFPKSDRIDDAAYRAAQICEHFNDRAIALLYYQRTYQWDPQTPYPAKFKAAYILDKYLHRRAEALELYEQALQKPDLPQGRKAFIDERIAFITKSSEKEKTK